jgi:phospholipid-binding lipoprotein MlaA
MNATDECRERNKMTAKNIFGVFLISGVLLAGPVMAEGNLDQGTVTRESAQVSVRNETAAKSKVALAEPVDGAVSEKGTVLKAEAAPQDEAAPRDEVTLADETVPKDEISAKEEAEIEEAAEELTIADPIEPVNRAMFQFNDKLYFWALKPAARGYNAVVPEPVRVSVKNFFKNVAMPIRFVNSLLQGKFKGAVNELSRFGINTTIGLVGFFDVAKSRFDLMPQERDLGQTLGVYGMGGLMYIVWPFLGPSTVRDTIGLAGDSFMYPVSYIEPFEAAFGVGAYERLNKTSLELGNYEDMKAASVEPYIGVRDAYIQYRKGLINK